jgi:hypothetical protein
MALPFCFKAFGVTHFDSPGWLEKAPHVSWTCALLLDRQLPFFYIEAPRPSRQDGTGTLGLPGKETSF